MSKGLKVGFIPRKYFINVMIQFFVIKSSKLNSNKNDKKWNKKWAQVNPTFQPDTSPFYFSPTMYCDKCTKLE